MPSVSGNVGAVASVSSVFGRNGGVVAANGDYAGVVAAHLTGATAATRYVGGTASGAPVAGTFAVGDFVIEQTGKVYVCTVAGTPGTWVAPGGSSAANSFLSTSQAAAGVHPPAAGSLIVFDFPADGANGSDITLSSDGEVFTLVNSGIYSIFVSVLLSVTLADTPIVKYRNVSTDAGDPFNADSPADIVGDTVAAGASLFRTHTLPAMWWTGGATFSFLQQSNVSDTNVTMFNTVVLISRVL